jgi:hypothetical protein
VAQLGARFHGMEEVIGSIPIRSTNNSIKMNLFQTRRREERQGPPERDVDASFGRAT